MGWFLAGERLNDAVVIKDEKNYNYRPPNVRLSLKFHEWLEDIYVRIYEYDKTCRLFKRLLTGQMCTIYTYILQSWMHFDIVHTCAAPTLVYILYIRTFYTYT